MNSKIEWLDIINLQQFQLIENELKFKYEPGFEHTYKIATYKNFYLCAGDGCLEYEKEFLEQQEVNNYLETIGLTIAINCSGHGGPIVKTKDVQ